MAWTAELLANHRALSELDVRFRDYAMATPKCLDLDYLVGFGFREPEVLYYTGMIHPWPFFAGPETLAEVERVTLGLSRLHRLIPKRIFADDPERIAEHYQLDPLHTARILESPSGLDSALGRADLVWSERGFQCLEFNFGALIGGGESRFRAERYERVPELREFFEREGLPWTAQRNSMRELFCHFIDEALKLDLGRDGYLNVALLLPKKLEFGLLQRFRGEYAAALEERGLSVDGRLYPSLIDDLEERRGALYCGGRRIHGLLETIEGTHPAAFPLAAAGNLVLFNGPIQAILSGKNNLALLSENQESERFTPEERALIRAHLPWTRKVERREVRFDGKDWDLATLLTERRGDLVLKACHSLGGKDVAVGHACTEEEWLAAIEAAFSAPWIVQEFVQSRGYLALSDAGVEPHDLIWGPFAFGNDRFGGTFLRLQPARIGGPVNVKRAGSAASLFEA
ncbi:MAG TPA: hypothetical protein VGS22_09910 [Thermoanaerobaculia bacterium]|jgi:hypothetical protein|nr:hypothetical protein [Thermoanaerobaculia bacterium]